MKTIRIHVAACALAMGMSAPLQADVFTYKTFDVEGAEATMIYAKDGKRVVGTYSNTMSSEDLQIHGFLTYDFADDMASTTHILDVPGAWETHPWNIASNKIVGYYVDTAGYHGFVATPEPSILPLLGSGLGATCCRRRRPRRPSSAGG